MNIKNKIKKEDILEEIRGERESNRKVFRMKDGKRMMAISNEPIHFWNKETKQYEEINTELIEDTNGFCGKCGNYEVTLPDGQNNIDTVKVKHGDSSISWEYVGINLPENNKKRHGFTRHPRPYVDTVDSHVPHMEKGKGKRTLAQYSNIDDGIDFQYEVKSGSLKENIVIRHNREAYNFGFNMHVKVLVPVLTEDKHSISFFKPGTEECLFKIPEPFMTDAKGETSKAIEYDLKETSKGEYFFTIKADAEWINAPDRAMPVTVDPAVEYLDFYLDFYQGMIRYTNTNSNPNGITLGYDGKKSWTSSITTNINGLPKDVYIELAFLYLEQKSFRGHSNFKWCIEGEKDTVPCEVLADGEGKSFVITKSISYIHEMNRLNGVFTARPYNDTQTSSTSDNSKCCDDDCISSDPKGSLVLDASTAEFWVIYSGLNDYVDNQTTIQPFQPKLDNSSVNESINLFTGELIYNQDDISTGSVAFPVTVSHRYIMATRNSSSVFGNGWKLSLDQSVVYAPEYSVIAEYTDGNGKKHYFVEEGTEGIYKDVGGLDLTFEAHSDGYYITDRSCGKLSFDMSGHLTSISDANGNHATIIRDGTGNITQVRDNFGRTITMTYNSSGNLAKMTDPSGREVTYTYSSSKLQKITYPDSTNVQFEYDDNNRITQVMHIDGTKTVYRYSSSGSDRIPRVVRVEQYGVDESPSTNAPVEYRNINYRSSRTTEVSDRTGINKVYAFDETGRTILEYEIDPANGGCDDYCEPLHTPYETTGTVVYQYADKKRSFASSLRSAKDSDNFVVNGNFSDEEDESWIFVGTGNYNEGIINNKYRLNGNGANKYIKQTISAEDVHFEYGDTLILSAWAMANSHTTGVYESGPKFEIRAEVHYTDNTTEEINALYDCTYKEWQYAALPIRLNKDKKDLLDYITVYLDYSNNKDICWFSNVRLVNAPAQSATYEKDPNTNITIFGVSQRIKERVTTHDGIYTVVDEKNENYDVVRRTITDMNGSSFVSVFKYDDKHRLIRTQNYRGIVTDYTYNDVGMQTSVKSYYYEDFNRSNISDPVEYFYQETTYDETGEFATEVGDNRSEDIKTTNNYNKTKGLLLGTTSPNGQETTYEYNSLNDLVTKVSSIVDGNEYSVLYSYDSARRLSSIAHNGFDYDFTYDGMSRAKTVSIADTVYTTNDYTLTDTTTVSTTYVGGEVMTVETDRHQQPVKRTYTDKNGNTTTMVTGEYDSLGKPTKVIDKVTNKVYTYEYDTYENVTEEKVNGETFKSYEYDNHGRLEKTTISVGDGTQVYKPIYDKFEGDICPDNTVVGVKLEGVFTANSAHDDLGRVTSKALTLAGATNPLISEEISYLDVTSAGKIRLTNIVDEFTNKVNGIETDKLTYTYDNNGNITEVNRNNEVIIQYAYDGLNQLIREDNAILGKIYTFNYDTSGNITEKKILNRTALGVGVLEQTIPYEYATTGWKDRLTSYNGEAITYDALGNPITYRGHNLTWGKIKQLEAYDSNTFAYNAEGIRTRKNTTTYELDGTKILREVRPNGAIEYFYGISGVAGFKYNGTSYYYQKNLQGDVTAIYTATGTKVAEYIYDAWGNCTVTLDTNGIGTLNPFRYRGYYFDTETGLYYLQSRYYNPEIGRFINADNPEISFKNNGSILQYNLYTYCWNNCISMADYTGESPANIIGGIVGGIAGAALGYILADALHLTGWKKVALIAAATVGGAALGAFLGPYIAKLGKSFAAKLVEAVSKQSIKISSEKLWKGCANHIFSKDHIKDGIMKLGESQESIFNEILGIVKSSLPDAVEGSNQIHTIINGIDTTIRFNIANGEVISINAFVGWATRIIGNLI